ncbi:MAG TPA: GerMN domain-containing protein [Leptolyngbyaceae cyanobacterium]
MDNRPPRRRISNAAIATVGGLIVAIGAGTVWLALNPPTPTPTPTPTATNTPSSIEQSPVAQPETAEVYWLQEKDNKFELVARPVTLDKTASKDDSAILEQAFNRLLAGPGDSLQDVSSSIPDGTKLRSVKVENDTVNVDLSQEFTEGGGSASMTGRLGQVIYTATSLNPNAKVTIAVDGKQLETLGGEGLELEQPLTRESFQKNFPL